MKINEQWEALKEDAHANIQSEKGILNRQPLRFLGKMKRLVQPSKIKLITILCSLDNLIQFSRKTLTSGESPFLPNCGFGIVRKKKNYPIPYAAWERV